MNILLGFQHSLCQNLTAPIYFSRYCTCIEVLGSSSSPCLQAVLRLSLQSSVLDNSFAFCSVFLKDCLSVLLSKWTIKWLVIAMDHTTVF